MKYNFSIDLESDNTHSQILKRIPHGSTVIEFGPATGYMTQYMQQNLNCKVYAVELDKEAALIAEPFTEKIVVCDIESFEWVAPFTNLKANVIIFADVLEHLRKPTDVLKKACEFLTSEGIVITSIPNIAHSAVIIEMLSGEFNYRPLGLLDNTHVHFFTKKNIIDLISDAGLAPIEWHLIDKKPEHTELQRSYHELPYHISKFISSRPDADIYQYITVSKRKAFVLNDELQENNIYTSYLFDESIQLFWSSDGTFIEENSIRLPIDINDEHEQKIDFPLPMGEINKVRIDPCNHQSLIKLGTIILYSKDSENKEIIHQEWTDKDYDELDFVNLLELGQPAEQFFVAYNEDPQIIIKKFKTPMLPDHRFYLRVNIKISKKIDSLISLLDDEKIRFKEIQNQLLLKENRFNVLIAEKEREIEAFKIKNEQIMNEMQSEILNNRLTISKKDKEIKNLEEDSKSLKKDSESLMKEYESLKKDSESLMKEYESLKVNFASLKHTLMSKEESLELLNQSLEETKQHLSTLLNSNSWKITSPLRNIKTVLKRVKRKLVNIKKTITIKIEKNNSIANVKKKIKSKDLALIISHTNYLKSMGGTEKYIYEQGKYLSDSGLSILQVFPGKLYNFLQNEKSYYGMNLDEDFLGYFTIEQLLGIIVNCKKSIKVSYIHHLLYWQASDFKKINKILSESRVSIDFFMHDFFSCCSSYHMIFKNSLEEKPCIPLLREKDTNDICLQCDHYTKLLAWRKYFSSFLKDVNQIIVPSNFVRDSVSMIYPEFIDKVHVNGHLKLVKADVKLSTKKPRDKVKLAYLGYKMENKGWSVWEKLYKHPRIQEKFELHHVGSAVKYSENVKIHEYSFIKDGIMAAVNILKNEDIDIVLLWSVVPESYSYTLFEAIAAGVPILTNPRSGNIAEIIRSNEGTLGKVISGEENLFKFLLNDEELRKLVVQNRQRYFLEFNGLPIC